MTLSDGTLPRPPEPWRSLLRLLSTETDRAYLTAMREFHQKHKDMVKVRQLLIF